jgi:hypothetical protein
MVTEKELRVIISSVTPRFDKLSAEKQVHPSHCIRHMKPEVRVPLQDITLLVSDMKLSYMLHTLHLVTNAATRFQFQQLLSRKQNVEIVLYFVVIPLPTA